MVVTRKCNLKCGYCNEYDLHSDSVPQETLIARIDKLKQLGTLGIEFTGGEPLLHPGIFDLVTHASRKRFLTRWMISNAFLLTEEKVVKLNAAKLTDMQISIDGVKPNDVTVKVLDKLRSRLELLSRLAKFRVTISAVVGAAPAAEVWEVIQFAKHKGFKPRVLLLHGDDGALKLSPNEVQLYRDLQRYLGQSANESKNYRMRLINGQTAPFKCRAGSRYLYIDEHGSTHLCSQTMERFSKPILEYTPEDLREQFYSHKGCSALCTVGCARTASKLDEWRYQHQSNGQTSVPK